MPRRGDILLYQGRGFVPRMIRSVTQSKWSHVAWVLNDETVLESDWSLFGNKGVQVSRIDKYEKDRVVFVRPQLSDSDLDTIVDLALRQAGRSYDWGLFLGLFRKWLFHTATWWRKERVRNDSHSWICSELVATPSFIVSGFRFLDDVDVGNIWPGDIGDSVNLGKTKEVIS